MSNSLKVGDQVLWRDRWGAAPPRKVTIKSIEVCAEEHCKVGAEVPAVDWEFTQGRYIMLEFKENSSWAWGYQINKLNDHWEGYENDS